MRRIPYITCPVCGCTSYSTGDIVARFCGNCHRHHDEMSDKEIMKATGDRFAWERFTRKPLGRLLKWWLGRELRR